MEDANAVRIARNDAIFRDANERIRDRAIDHDVTESIPFLCECAEPSCTTIVRLPLAEYERIRADPTWFFNAPGHSEAGGSWVTVVESYPGYEVLVKRGVAAEIVKEADPRSRT
jgi:hypothetical protein